MTILDADENANSTKKKSVNTGNIREFIKHISNKREDVIMPMPKLSTVSRK
ncbi:hypothetical protein [Chitinophaga sp. CF418]|uniref:hypothetical protein n=1 Tax=Chitinophaga sp. CF418 TaxID=1855287 RepID=UPI00091650EC|nr:hypothetical protein [Chitinophaga sp. CF418]SHN07582.1 hypothetical protein SAMN05216311_10535 [Chitinophaga sp. CF418]